MQNLKWLSLKLSITYLTIIDGCPKVILKFQMLDKNSSRSNASDRTTITEHFTSKKITIITYSKNFHISP